MKLEKFRAEEPIAAIFSTVNTGSWRQEYPAVDHEACVACGIYQGYCPVDAITIRKNQEDCMVFAWDFCKGRGIYANECPKACMKMTPVGGGK